MEEQHPFREVRIEGMTARAMLLLTDPTPPKHPERPRELMSVRTAAEVDEAMGDPENQHHCPLCNNEYGTAAFAAHAPACINTHVPREKMWLPAGTAGAIQTYSDERPRRPGSGLYDAY